MLTQPSTSNTTSGPGFCLTSAGSVPATDAENAWRGCCSSVPRAWRKPIFRSRPDARPASMQPRPQRSSTSKPSKLSIDLPSTWCDSVSGVCT